MRGSSRQRASIVRAQIADRARQLVAARRRLAEPERDRRRRALGVGDAHHAAADLQDAPRRVAELEDVAGHALDREVLVQRADERVVGLEHDAVVGDFGNRAAGRDRQHARAAAAAQPCRCTSSRWTSAPRRPRRVAKPSASIATTASKSLAREVAVRPGAPRPARRARPRRTPRHAASATICCASTSSGASCDDDAIELAARGPRAAAPRTRRDRRATIGNRRPFGSAGDGVAGAADALQERGDAVRRADLADEIDVADVDAELERRGRDQRLERARSSAAPRRRAASPSTGCRGAR